MEGENSYNTRQINYKGKIKDIPKSNADSKLCEFYIVARMRYCKFEKHAGSQFCIYHLPNDTIPDVAFVDCPIDPSHRVLADKFKRHVKVCNKLGEKKRLTENPWYKEKVNKVLKNDTLINNIINSSLNEESIQVIYSALKWEDLTEDEYSQTLEKIKNCYETLKNDYLNYIENEELQKLLNEKLLNKLSIENENLNLSISGTQIFEDDFQFTKDLAKSEKNGKQNKAISDVLSIFGLLNKNDVYIEFGAGKGGLSHYINTLTNDQSLHILLEREGVRYKRDKYSDNLIRVITS
jgi:tRNA:m4X modification enzyme